MMGRRAYHWLVFSSEMAQLCLRALLFICCFVSLALATTEATRVSEKPDPGGSNSFTAQSELTTAGDQEPPFPADSGNLSIASLLRQNGLPIGLFPSPVENFTLSDDGRFSYSLPKACLVDFDYESYFAETITGRLSYGAISDLSGIKANDGFVWLSVTGIRHDESSVCYIYFDFETSSKTVSIWQFQSVPVCTSKDLTLRSCEEKCEKTGCVNKQCYPSCKVTVNGGSSELLQSRHPFDSWIKWDCANECRFQCMMLQEAKRRNDGQPPMKYNRKWPFKRVLGFQEPLSVAFSVVNIAVHLQGLMSFLYLLYFVLPKRPEGRKDPYYEYGLLWTAYGLAALNSWVWSAAYHARNALVLEKIDHSSGVGLLGLALVVAIIRTLSLRIEATQVMVAAPVMAFVSTHILYLNFYNYEYGWNTGIATIMEALQLLIWAVWAVFVHHPSRTKLWSVIVFSLMAKSVKILDFPPWWGVLDAHALWHGFHVLLTWLWWTFIKEDVYYRTLKLLRQAQETVGSKKSQ